MTSPSCIIQLTLNLEHNINSVWEICASSYTWKRGCKTGARVTAVPHSPWRESHTSLHKPAPVRRQASRANQPATQHTCQPDPQGHRQCCCPLLTSGTWSHLSKWQTTVNSGSPTLRDNTLPLPWVGSKLHEECKQSSDPTQDRKLFWDQRDTALLLHWMAGLAPPIAQHIKYSSLYSFAKLRQSQNQYNI